MGRYLSVCFPHLGHCRRPEPHLEQSWIWQFVQYLAPGQLESYPTLPHKKQGTLLVAIDFLRKVSACL
ncbi:MAG: hypothetical protein BZ151_11140 [Desulfobacca sp. 4484_104]|nr:MAG: hypothetical protein BZ151_11140 [Desulfobacca sp. 4484_104]